MWRHPDGRDDWAMVILGAWLRDWRYETGVTQRHLARLSGVDQAHISRIERGLRRPSGIPFARLVIALDWLSTSEGFGRPFGSLDREPPPREARWGRGRPPIVLGPPPAPLPASLAVDPDRMLDALLGVTDLDLEAADHEVAAVESARVLDALLAVTEPELGATDARSEAADPDMDAAA